MTKIDIISGFLGAGKTTLIKKLIQDVFQGEKLVLIENEFGEIGIDGGFMKEAGIEITEMNSGCICCSLVGDFGEALKEVLEKYTPDRVIIEPSGVGKLSDVVKAVENIQGMDLHINSTATVVDVKKCKMYMKNYGEFYNNQIESAGTIILSRTQDVDETKLQACLDMIHEHNTEATVITTPWDDIDGTKVLEAMERVNRLEQEMLEEHQHAHHHDGECCHDHEHHHDGECCHGHHHHDGECCHEHEHHHDGECCHDHEHHHHDGECCHDHEHHHDGECCHDHEHHHHDGECCHDHEHHHHDGECCHGHHHHHADEVFTSWGMETAHRFDEGELKKAVEALAQDEAYGQILRAKGIVASTEDGVWLHFDMVPEEVQIRHGGADYTGKLCVIGANLNEDKIKELFGVNL